jgi:NAD(P)-dependent dehydrogenase (short-subunit alcohol dehydrogenase family)
MSLENQNALVVGGGTGMGEAIALALAAEGAKVAVAGRRQEKLDAVSKQAEGKILTHPVDVAERESVKSLFDWADAQFGGQLHLLVNCAGVNVPKRSMSELAPEDWDKVMAINATGAFNCMHFGLPLMRPHQTGLVINISSTSGKRAAPLGGLAYNASKFAMAAIGTSASEDERENGIRVTTIFPGEVDTPILDDRPVPPDANHRAHILKPADIAAITVAVAKLPPLAHVPELVIKPIGQSFI